LITSIERRNIVKRELMNLTKRMKNHNENHHSFKKSIISMCLFPLIAGLVLCISPAPEAEAVAYELCTYTQYAHPDINKGLVVIVRKEGYHSKPTGEFYLIQNIDGHRLSYWVDFPYSSNMGGWYYGTKTFIHYPVPGTIYRINLYISMVGGKPLCMYEVYKQSLVTIWGRSVWIGTTYPLKKETVYLTNSLGCSRH
jgi:hypothetical protein